MARFTLRLPDSLHDQIAETAEKEGVSMNQYIVYALTRQMSPPGYEVRLRSAEEKAQDRRAMDALLEKLGEEISPEEMQQFIRERRGRQAEIEQELEFG